MTGILQLHIRIIDGSSDNCKPRNTHTHTYYNHLCASLVRAATAVGGSEAEAAGAALGVGRVQMKRTNSALITARTLDVLLHEGDTHSRFEDTQSSETRVCVCICVHVPARSGCHTLHKHCPVKESHTCSSVPASLQLHGLQLG